MRTGTKNTRTVTDGGKLTWKDHPELGWPIPAMFSHKQAEKVCQWTETGSQSRQREKRCNVVLESEAKSQDRDIKTEQESLLGTLMIS